MHFQIKTCFLKSSLALAALWLVACANVSPGEESESLSETQKPNILWIMAEDMGPDLGIYGEPESLTPNLDAIGTQGMVFERAFTTAPICSISRSAFYTGMYQTTIGAHQHRTPQDRKPALADGVKLLTDHFRAAGYFTSLILTIEKPGGPEEWLVGRPKRDWNFRYDGEPYDGYDMNELKDNQPFFAHVQFSETHRGHDWDTARERIPTPADPDKIDLPPYYPDHPIAREDWAGYLDAVMAFDQKVGIVMRRLEEEGLADNTIVMAWADHGRAMVRGKQWLYDSGLHVPLLIYVPEGVEVPDGYLPGERTDQLISGIDITATSLALAGIERGDVMQGRAFLGDLDSPRDYVFAARDRADSTPDYMRSVRGDRFLYIRNYMPEKPYAQLNIYKQTSYPVMRLMHRLHDAGELGPIPARYMSDTKPAEELYDTQADPHQINNLATDPDYADVLEDMRVRLAEWEIETDDKGRIPEPGSVAKSYEKAILKKRAELINELIEKEGQWRDDLPKQ